MITSSERDRVINVGDVRQATISGLTQFTEYTVSVAAVNNAGFGVYSNGATIRTKSKISTGTEHIALIHNESPRI